MTTFAYLRVSSLAQDEQNQRLGVDNKARQLNLSIDKYIIDKVSGTIEPNHRNLGKLLRKAKEGDVIIVSELSRLGRKLFMLFRTLEDLMKKGVKVYSVKDNFTLDSSIQSTVMAFAFGLAAQIERDMISQRTKEALALRKANGMHLGRPFGFKMKHNKVEKHIEKIRKWRQARVSKVKISKRIHCCQKTLNKYMVIYGL